MKLVIAKMHALEVFTLLGLIVAGNAAKLPSGWGKCHKSDKNFSDCLAKNVEYAISTLNTPTPELGLTTFDPLDIPELYIGEGKGPVNVAQHFFNIKLHGLTGSKVTSSYIDWNKKALISESITPMLRLEAEYKMKGRILLLPMVGDGPCNVTLYNMKIHHEMLFDYFQKKNKTYMKVTDFKVKMNPERVEFKFDNLFDGQKELGDNINKILNENNNEVFADVRGGYENSFGLIFKDLANRVLPKVPVKDIFLD